MRMRQDGENLFDRAFRKNLKWVMWRKSCVHKLASTITSFTLDWWWLEKPLALSFYELFKLLSADDSRKDWNCRLWRQCWWKERRRLLSGSLNCWHKRFLRMSGLGKQTSFVTWKKHEQSHRATFNLPCCSLFEVAHLSYFEKIPATEFFKYLRRFFLEFMRFFAFS